MRWRLGNRGKNVIITYKGREYELVVKRKPSKFAQVKRRPGAVLDWNALEEHPPGIKRHGMRSGRSGCRPKALYRGGGVDVSRMSLWPTEPMKTSFACVRASACGGLLQSADRQRDR